MRRQYSRISSADPLCGAANCCNHVRFGRRPTTSQYTRARLALRLEPRLPLRCVGALAATIRREKQRTVLAAYQVCFTRITALNRSSENFGETRRPRLLKVVKRSTQWLFTSLNYHTILISAFYSCFNRLHSAS